MQFARIRRALAWLRQTPLHPQWLVFLEERRLYSLIGRAVSGRILDVGCGERRAEKHLPTGSEYIGLDYYVTATTWYRTTPDIFGDAAQLPVADQSIDGVLLLDVLEHLREPAACMSELVRVLRTEGRLVLQVPFLYPIHDAPLDFSRWTLYGLRQLAHNHGFRVIEEQAIGHPVETSALLVNLAFSKLVLTSARHGHPLVLLGLVLPFIVFLANVLAWLLSKLGPRDTFMAHGYRLLLEKRRPPPSAPIHAASAY